MGKPDEHAVERPDGFLVEVVRAGGDLAYPVFEFLYRFRAHRRLAASEMETEEVKAFDEVRDLRLGGRQRQSQLLPEGGVYKLQSLFGLGVGAAQHHEVVGIADEPIADACQTLVKDIQDDIRQEWRNHPALRCASDRRTKRTLFHHASGEELAEETQDIPVGNPVGHQVEDKVMGDIVEEGLNIGIHDPFEPGFVRGVDRFDGLVGVTTETETKRELREVRLEDGFEK